MKVSQLLPALAMVPGSLAAETIVGVYMFHRHGDRTPKILPPSNLTDLGYSEVYQSGQYYNKRYITSSSPIYGISSALVNEEQIQASAPIDPVLQNSAQGFLQGLYPPVGITLGSEKLANGTDIHSPMQGYQLIPVNVVESGSGSENSGWLQDSTECLNAELSSNDYFYSPPYMALEKSTFGFYQNLLPALAPMFNKSSATYYNAYEIFDYLNVAQIHNSSYKGKDLITPSVFHQLLTLANVHEYNLAYNKSSPIRAMAGRQLAAEIVDFFVESIESQGTIGKYAVQFGSYGTFFSFFGAAGLTAKYPQFKGIVNYASSMSFELFTTKPFTTYPKASDLMVRFFFHNGTASDSSPPQPFALFDQSKMELSWSDFKMQMGKFSVGNSAEWCHLCGNTTGTCLQYSLKSANVQGRLPTSGQAGGMSNAVAGVIGAMVTLAVILIIELAILFIGGFRIVSKKRLVAGKSVANGTS